MRVMGIDPGSVVTGWGIIEASGATLTHVASGTIRTASLQRGPERLKKIHDNLIALIDEHRPDAMSLERSFVAASVQSAFRLGEARAMAMLAAADREIELFEYAPNEVKLSVAAFGHAEKAQVKFMVRRTLRLDDGVELADDESDALALAICHSGRARMTAMERIAQPARRGPARWMRR
ncbi:MAG TPA: crossover junction endodeoxyribonuclease RuvC [Candidatus Binataceae bacterium]|nr:crossover junction endodeoxyribonuclease RuvC [Candidatus Binataceae bacterium]